MRKQLLFFFFIITSLTLSAQDFRIDDYHTQTVQACRGRFLSSNNCFANTINKNSYCNNEDYWMTFDSGDPNKKVRINFFRYNIEQGFDSLYFFDGNSISSPLIDAISGFENNGPTSNTTKKSAYIVTSNGRYLTVRFTSDNAKTYQDPNNSGGWYAFIGCEVQNCTPTAPAASDSCITSTEMCALDGYCGNTSGWYSAGDEADNISAAANGPFCGTLQNNSWISFTAEGTFAAFEITSSNCAVSNSGIQAIIFETTDCNTFNAISNCIDQNSGSGADTLATNTPLVPGRKYHIMFDGYAGNACDYTVNPISGVSIVDIDVIGPQNVCAGQCIDLNVSTNTPGATFSWTSNPNQGPHATTNNITVCPQSTTTYTAEVAGICGATQQTQVTINQVNPKAGFDAIQNQQTIHPFPQSIDCEKGTIALLAHDSSKAGHYITPSLHFSFTSDANAVGDQNTVKIYEGLPGSGGKLIHNVNLSNNSTKDILSEYLNSSSEYYIEICDQSANGGVDFYVADGNTGTQYISTSLTNGTTCKTYGPITPKGNSQWTTSAPAASYTTTTWGALIFDPTKAPAGSYSFTYSWSNTIGCSDSHTKTIQVVNPFNAAWLQPGTLCEKDAPINLNSFITGTQGGTWSGNGVVGNTFNPKGFSGIQKITYTVGTLPCGDTMSHYITVQPTEDPSWIPDNPICEATGTINLDSFITGTTGGTWSGNGVIGNTFNLTGWTGNQSITYNVGAAGCQESNTQNISVIPTANPSWTTFNNICKEAGDVNLDALITGDANGTWTGQGITGAIFNPSNLTTTTTNISYTTGILPCKETLTHQVIIDNEDDASFVFNGGTFCVSGNNPTPNILGTNGGTFSILPSGTIDPATGEINLSATGVGNYQITYNTLDAGNPCPNSKSTFVTITDAPSASFQYNQTSFCSYDTNPVISFPAQSSAGTFTFSAIPQNAHLDMDLVGNINLSTSDGGTFTIYNTIAPSGGCGTSIDSASITIHNGDNTSFFYNGGTYCESGNDPTPTINGTAGGSFTIAPSGSINPISGQIDLQQTGHGNYVVTYSTQGLGSICPSSSSQFVAINPAPKAAFSYDNTSYCKDGINPVITIDPNSQSGVFSFTAQNNSNNSLDIAPQNGNINLANSDPDTYTVYNTIMPANGCGIAIDSFSITVLEVDNPSFNYLGGTFCITGTDPIPIIHGLTGGNFSITPSNGDINPASGKVDISASGLGIYEVIYNTTPIGNACPRNDSVLIIITDYPKASFNYSSPIFCQNEGTTSPQYTNNGSGGLFSYQPLNGPTLIMNPLDGDINLSNSDPGTYTIYNSIAPSGGCAESIDSTIVTIHAAKHTNQAFNLCTGDSIFVIDQYIFQPGTYNDTLTTYQGCDSVIITTIISHPTPPTNTLSDTVICLNNNGSTVVYPFAPGGTITWYSDPNLTQQIGQGTAISINGYTPGAYEFYFQETLGICQSQVQSLTVTIHDVSAAFTPSLTSGITPIDISFTNNSIGANQYQWNIMDTTLTNYDPKFHFEEPGDYVVQLIASSDICIDSTEVNIHLDGLAEIIIPNVFTPNGDGSNDVFVIQAKYLESISCEIYNRWGQLVFSWDYLEGIWDGRAINGDLTPAGTYFCIIKAESIAGETIEKNQSFSLLR